jgi:hypothetical protein
VSDLGLERNDVTATVGHTVLAAAPCNPTLPAGDLVDAFDFARFAPLRVTRDGVTGSAVLPNDHVVPDAVGFVKGRIPPDRREALWRGGVPLVETWDPVNPRVDPTDLVKVTVGKVADFIADPKVTIDGQARDVTLSPNNVHELLATGAATVVLNNGLSVHIEAQPDVETLGLPHTPVGISSVEAFLSDPKLDIDGHTVGVSLSPTNVQELQTVGTTRVELDVGGGVLTPDSGGTAAYVTVTAGGPVASQRSALTAGGKVHDVQHPGGSTHKILKQMDDGPGEAKLPTFEFALYLPFRQEWRLLGHARGELLNSIPLTPQEETTVEVFTWDRRTATTMVTTTAEREATIEGTLSQKETVEVLAELTRTNDWRQEGHGGVTLPPVKGVSVSGGFSQQTSENVHQVNRRTLNAIDEAAFRASSRIKATRQTQVTELHELGREFRVTRRLKNANMCRTVTYDFFQIQATYEVTTKPLPELMQLAVLAPNPFPARITQEFLLAHEGTLAGALLDKELKGGFAAARKLAASAAYCSYRCAKRCACDEAAPASAGAGAGAATGTQATEVKDPVEVAKGRVLAADTAVRDAVAKIAAATHRVASVYDTNGTDEEKKAAIREYHWWLFRKFGLEWFNPGFWGACEQYAADEVSPERLERLLGEVAGSWFETLVRGAFLQTLAAVAGPIMAAELIYHLGWKTAWYAQFTDFEDAGLGAALSQAQNEVRLWRNAVAAEISGATTGAGPTPTGSSDGKGPAVPPVITGIGGSAAAPSAFPPEELAEAEVAVTALLAHITENRSHYDSAIWRAMDPTDRQALVGVFGSLGQFVDADVLGFVGGKVALAFDPSSVDGLAAQLEAMAKQVADKTKPFTRTLTIPTRGVDVRSRLGECDTCEPFLADHRELDLEQTRVRLDIERERLAQARTQTERHQARLKQQPPLLDDPGGDPTGALNVVVASKPDDQPPPGP